MLKRPVHDFGAYHGRLQAEKGEDRRRDKTNLAYVALVVGGVVGTGQCVSFGRKAIRAGRSVAAGQKRQCLVRKPTTRGMVRPYPRTHMSFLRVVGTGGCMS